MTSGNTSRDLTAVAIKHVFLPLWAAKNGSARLRYLANLERSQYWTHEALAAHQLSSAQKLVAHAFETCSYYREKYSRAGFAPGDLKTIDDMRNIPALTKEEVQEHRDAMISSSCDRKTLIPDMTGGSTGSPMRFFYSKDRLDSREAAALRHNRWAGWDIGDRAAVLWGAPRDTSTTGRLKDHLRDWVLGRRLLLDASSLDDAAMREFASQLLSYRPNVLLAYANTLGLFARYLQATGTTGIRPRGIVCSAEVLTDENRKLIERTFQCDVFNRYGSREFSVIASECSKHEGMHVNAENLLLEVVSGRQERDHGGEIVITDLRNFAMPMIRYRTRDVGRLKSHACSCGRGLPLMDLAGGRVTDFLVATNGKKVSGIVLATYVITNIVGVRQVQFVQTVRGEVTIKAVKGPHWSDPTEVELMRKAREFLGADMRMAIEFQQDIPLEKSGKFRFTICTLNG